MGIKIIIILYFQQPNIPTVAGDDYTAVDGEELAFPRGSTRRCHTIDIVNDDICETDPNEFYSDLAYVSGVQPITIDPSTAQVVIDDSRETECSKYD